MVEKLTHFISHLEHTCRSTGTHFEKWRPGSQIYSSDLTVLLYQCRPLGYFVIADCIFTKIMKYHTLPGFLFIVRIPAMKEISMPYNQIAFFREKLYLLQFLVFDSFRYHIFIIGIGFISQEECISFIAVIAV